MVFIQYLYYVFSISSRSLFLMMMMMMMMNLVFAAEPTGLSLKLIHRDNLNPENLTKLESMSRAFQRSIDRQQKLLSTWHQQVISRNNSTNYNSKSDINALSPPLKFYDETSYMLEIGIGTFSNVGGSPTEPRLIPAYYYFYFDTGSDLVWLQCQASRTGYSDPPHYFVQEKPIYPGQNSITYSPFPYDSPDPICRKYVRMGVPREGSGYCGYRMEYADGASTEGVLATEKLTISKGDGGVQEIKEFVFGCGYRQNEPDFGTKAHGQNLVAGILGLGGGPESFIKQLGRRGGYRFEYCLRKYDGRNPDAVTFLRIGSNIKIFSRGRAIQTTTTLPVRGFTLEYVTMLGISINGDQVVYNEPVFTPKQDGTGGCVFDSGTDLTELSTAVYVPFVKHLVNYVVSNGGKRRQPTGKWSNYGICFQKTESFNVLPIIVFHYSRADFAIGRDSAFASDSQTFCLNIARSSHGDALSVVLGSSQLVNHRMLHDIGQRTISWIDEDCSIDP